MKRMHQSLVVALVVAVVTVAPQRLWARSAHDGDNSESRSDRGRDGGDRNDSSRRDPDPPARESSSEESSSREIAPPASSPQELPSPREFTPRERNQTEPTARDISPRDARSRDGADRSRSLRGEDGSPGRSFSNRESSSRETPRRVIAPDASGRWEAPPPGGASTAASRPPGFLRHRDSTSERGDVTQSRPSIPSLGAVHQRAQGLESVIGAATTTRSFDTGMGKAVNSPGTGDACTTIGTTIVPGAGM